MIDLITFFLSCVMGVGDVTAGGKRKERSPLTKLDVKSRAMEAEEIDLILKRKPIEKEPATQHWDSSDQGTWDVRKTDLSLSQGEHPGGAKPDR